MNANEAKKPIGFDMELTEEQLKDVAGGAVPILAYQPARVRYTCSFNMDCNCEVVRDYPAGTTLSSCIYYPHQCYRDGNKIDCIPYLYMAEFTYLCP